MYLEKKDFIEEHKKYKYVHIRDVQKAQSSIGLLLKNEIENKKIIQFYRKLFYPLGKIAKMFYNFFRNLLKGQCHGILKK